MKNMKLWQVVFAVWVFFWVFFLVRGFVKGEFKKFKRLVFSSYAEKRAYILGEELDVFLGVCKDQIPESATYKITGGLDEHNKFRMVYYLYPRVESDDPQYVLDISPQDSRYLYKRVR